MKAGDRDHGMTSPEPNILVAQRFQERFEFYLVALTFTLLGLAAQTAAFGQFALADLAELAAWGVLLLSGLTGLARLEGIPHLYELASMRSERLEIVTALRRGPVVGEVRFLNETLSVEDALAKQEANVGQIDEALEFRDAKLIGKARLQRRAFAMGLTMLVAARGLPPLVGMIRQVLD